MRLAALLILALPACALAQSAPPLPPKAATKPVTPDHAPTKPAAPAAKIVPKPTDKKPLSPKPTTKPTAKPAPRKPAPPPPVAVVPTPVAPAPAEPGKGSNTGLPIPRFAALRSDDVNFRSGPGTRYPIEWIYKRRDLPVEIEREFEIWRLVRDPAGNKGWVHQATLVGRRTAIVLGTEHALRSAASDTAAAVATLKAGVIIRLRSCDADSEWCQASIADYRGYIRRSDLWGLQPGEVIQ